MRIPQNHNAKISAANNAISAPTRQRNSGSDSRGMVSELNILEQEKVTISDGARRRLGQIEPLFNNESVGEARKRQAEMLASLTSENTNISNNATQQTDISQKLRELLANPWSGQATAAEATTNSMLREHGFYENNRGQQDLVAHFADNFRRTLSENSPEGIVSIADSAHFQLSTLANTYAELRQTIEERYTGDELEDRLRWLSQGFEVLSSDVAQSHAYAAQREMLRSEDTSGMSERELSLLNRKIESIGVDIKDLMLELAQALRSFAVENGLISMESSNVPMFSDVLSS